MKKTKKLVIAALIVLFLLSTSISFVAAESKQAGKYTFQAEGYTIEYILPCDADFYAEKDSYGPLEWGALAFGWDLFRVFFDDAKEREMGALTVYHLNKSYWQEWQERIYWKQVSTFKDFDEFFEFIQEILFWMEARRTTASGHEVIILEGDYGEKIFWVQVDDDNIFVIDAERAICSSPYPPVYCPDPKLFWEIVDEFVQSFKVTAIEQLHTYYVNPGESIQDAVDTASDGDTIIVYPGTYTENVNVNKRLTIKSENGAEATIVQAADSDDHVFMVKAGFVNISGFTVKGATGNRRAGIYIDAYHCTISNNTASNNCCGILLYSTSNNTVTNNNASNNHNCGIELFSSGNNIIANNNANWNSDHPHGGICLRVSSNNNTVMNNNALNNSCGIHLADSSNNNITDNNASNNVQGILLYYSSNNNITNNNANMNDMCGVHLCDSSSNDIMNNNALNLGSGIHLADSSNNNIMNNNISDGFYLYSSSNNIVYRNNFINNTWRNVDSYKSTNIWNSPSKITYTYNGNTFTSYLGNYWDDYKDKYPGAKDKDNTGIWNTPYEIDGDNDYYPLVEWVENYFPGQEVPELCTIPDPPSHDFGEVPEGVQKSWRFNIVNSGSGTLEWEVSVNNPWISVNPSSGYTTTEQDPVEVTIDTSGLSGCNQGTLLITSNGGAKQGTIEVVVEVIRIVDNDRRLLKPNTKADPEYKYPEYAEVSIYTETVSEDELNIYVELNTINECVDKDTNETLLVDFGHGFEKGAITVLADEEATVLWDEAKLMVKGELKSQEDWPWNGAKTLGEVAYSGAPCKLMKAKKTIDPLVGVIYKGGGIVPAFYYKYIGEMPYTEWKPSYKWGSIVGGELGRKLLIEKLPVLGDLTSIQKILKGWAEEDAFARLLEQDPQEIFVPNYDEVTRSWAGIMAPDQWHICRFNSVVLIVPIKIKPDKTHSVAVRGKAYPYVFSGGKFLTFAKHFEVNPGKPLAQLTTAGEPYIAPGFAGDNIMLDESVMHKNNTRMKFTVFARSPEADPFTKYIFVEVSQFPEYGGIGPHFAEIKGGFASITVEETAQVPEDKIITDHLLDVWTYMTYDPPIAYENYNSKTYEAIPVIEEASAWEAVEFITTKLIALKCPQVAELIGLVFTVDDIIKYLDDCTTDFKVMRINEAEMDTFTDIWAGKERIIGTSEKYASVVTVFPIRFCSSVDNTIAVRSGVIVGSHEFLYSNVLEIPNGTKEVTCPCVADSWMMPSG